MSGERSPRSSSGRGTSRPLGPILRLAAALLVAVPAAALLLLLAHEVPLPEPVRVEIPSALRALPSAPESPALLRGDSLAVARRLLVGLLGGGALWLLWLRARLYRLESAHARLRDRQAEERDERDDLRARLDELLAADREFVYSHDLEGGQLWIDERGLELLGYEGSELPELRLRDLLEADVLESARQQVDALAAGARPGAAHEWVFRRRDGRPLWAAVRPRLVRRDGVPVGVEVIARDVTAGRLEQLTASVQLGIVRAVSEAASLHAAFRGVLATLCRELGWQYGEIFWVDREYDVLRGVEGWRHDATDPTAAVSGRRTFGRGEALPGRAWLDGEPLRVEELEAEGDAWIAGIPSSAPFRRALLLPVHRAGRVRGVLGFLSTRGRPAPWAPLDVLDTVGAQIAALLEREETREALRASEARKHAMLESALDCVITVDSELRVLEFNPAAERTFGLPRGDVLGRNVLELIVPTQMREPARRLLLAFLEEETPPFDGRRVDFEGVRADGSPVPLEVAVSRIATAGSPILTAFLRDITERREINRLKDELVSTVSHELRTPLASMRGFVELLLMRDHSPEESREFLQIVDKEIKRLSKLIDDFLDVQRLESGALEYELRRHDLRELVSEAASIARGSSEEHAIAVDLPEAPLVARVDADRIRQVLGNLLSNAIKYSPEGGTVGVRARRAGRWFELSVSDEGIGMDAETQDRLFRKFFRADNTMARRIGGTGLGLALVREIVRAHGGGIDVESKPGEGSRFIVTLPAVGSS